MTQSPTNPPRAESRGAATVAALPRIVHEIRRPGWGRLRLRRRFSPAADLVRARERLERIEGVEEVRFSVRSRSVVVVYRTAEPAMLGLRQRLLLEVSRLDLESAAPSPPDPVRSRPSGLDAPAVALLGAGLVAVLVPFLPLRVRRIVVLASIASTVWKGVRAAFERGVSVEVLDGAAVLAPALRGRAGTAATTNFMLQLAAFVEKQASERSDDVVRGLLRATPEVIRVERGGVERELPYAEVGVGDRVVVMPGEQLAVDGGVVAGLATVDSSAITGESIPIPVEVGDSAKSGVVVLDGRLVVEAERIGDATSIARIRSFIERALTDRSRVQRVTDRAADRRVWVTFGAAAGVYALTGNISRLESISLVDFSCTSKLGTAVAIKSALFRAAHDGILVKGGDTLDALAQVDTVVFDKTGTLTTGELHVTEVAALAPGWTEDRVLALAASLAEHTTHPVAQSVVALVRDRGLAHIGHEAVEFMIGHGLTSRVDECEVVLGSMHFLQDHRDVDLKRHRPVLEALSADGDALLLLAREKELVGVIALRDHPRPEAPEVLAQVRALGVKRLVMVTGDSRRPARQVARSLQLDAVHAEIEPENKAAIVHALKEANRRVAFVGDGVNDGPALMAADVGIAMPRAADLARATADVVLLDDRLSALTEVLALARDSRDRLHRTLNTAAGVNTAVLALAATGRLSALAASVLHNGTTLAVLGASWFGSSSPRTPRLGTHPARGRAAPSPPTSPR